MELMFAAICIFTILVCFCSLTLYMDTRLYRDHVLKLEEIRSHLAALEEHKAKIYSKVE